MSVTKIDVPLAGLTSSPPVSVEEEIRRRLAADAEVARRHAFRVKRWPRFPVAMLQSEANASSRAATIPAYLRRSPFSFVYGLVYSAGT